MADDDQTSLEADTAFGKFKFVGKRTAEIISVLCLVVLLVGGFALYTHSENTEKNTLELKAVMGELKLVLKENAEAQREMIGAQREMTCMISIDADKREKVYFAPNGICKILGRSDR